MKDHFPKGKRMLSRKGSGSEWRVTETSEEQFPTRYLLSHLRQNFTEDHRPNLSALMDALDQRGWKLIEADRAVGGIPAGVAILHDGKERALVTIYGDGVAEWVGDILHGNTQVEDFVSRVEDVLATSPSGDPNNRADESDRHG